MDKKANDLIEKKTWSATPRDKPLASDKQVAPGDWALKERRLPNRTCRKCQVRFCAHGNLQKISNKKMQEAGDRSVILTKKEIKTQDITFKKHIKSFENIGDEINWETTVELDVTAFFGIQLNQNKKNLSFLGIQIDQSKKDSCHKLTQPALIKVSAVTRMKDCNSKPATCCGDEKPLGSDPEGAPAKEPNSALTKQALIVDDFHDASSPFVRELDNNDEITKPMEGFDLSNLHENNHESEDGSQLSFVIRKHGGKKSLTPFVRTDLEDKTNISEADVLDLLSLNCKDPS